MRPSYAYHSFPVFFPSPTLTHPLFHSFRKFVVSNTGPSLRKSFLSIPTSSADKGSVSGLRFLMMPAGRYISRLLRLTHCQRSEEHTSELQSPDHLVSRLLL